MPIRSFTAPRTLLRTVSFIAKRILLLFGVSVLGIAQSQVVSTLDRQRGHLMLKFIEKDLAENYVDPTFCGVDIRQRFGDADVRIDTTTSLDAMYSVIGGVLFDLNDSHTAFIPPVRTSVFRCGWDAQMIGDSCLITTVSSGSDAERKGLMPGMAVEALNGKLPSRAGVHRLEYTTGILCPSLPVRMTIRVGGSVRHLEVAPSLVKGDHQNDFIEGSLFRSFSQSAHGLDGRRNATRQRVHAFGEDLVVWRIPSFEFSQNQIDAVVEEILNARALVLDLRSNSGGSAANLSYLAGYFFNADIPLCYLDSRGTRDSILAGHQDRRLGGELFVLVDSKTTSSAEVFARTVQTQHRGLVLGDVTGGMVSKADYFPRKMGFQNVVSYGSFVTTATVTMPDGARSSEICVIPDVLLLPTSSDLALGRDPVLAHAAQLAGICIDATKAARLLGEK